MTKEKKYLIVLKSYKLECWLLIYLKQNIYCTPKIFVISELIKSYIIYQLKILYFIHCVKESKMSMSIPLHES